MRSHLYDCNFACASLFAGKLLSATPRDGLGEGMVPIFPHGAPLGAACSCAVISGLLHCYCVFLPGGEFRRVMKLIGNYWLGVLLYVLFAVVTADLLRLLFCHVLPFKHIFITTRMHRLAGCVCARHSDCVRLGGYQCANHPCDAE